QQLVGLLVLGSGRTMMSLLQYERVRSFVSLLGVKLPGYKSLQNCRRHLKKKMNFGVSESVSSLENRCFGLKIKQVLSQELANPYVMDHLEFIPTLPNSNCKINCLVQSKKWREGLDRNLRVQMVSSPNGHFFLYEPAQLYSQKIVIPIFFYKMDNEVLAKCVPAHQICKEGDDGKLHVRIEYRAVSSFDSILLSTINIKRFWRVFDQIELRPNLLMNNYCGVNMYGELRILFDSLLHCVQ
ncbi:hypothetical protein DFH28DRAFT_883888, partial [Melampsora americana]